MVIEWYQRDKQVIQFSLIYIVYFEHVQKKKIKHSFIQFQAKN